MDIFLNYIIVLNWLGDTLSLWVQTCKDDVFVFFRLNKLKLKLKRLQIIKIYFRNS